MKRENAKAAIERYRNYGAGRIPSEEIAEYCRLFGEVAEIAEEEAEERMRAEAVKAFCSANCPKGCSFGADGNVGCGAKYRFIQKLDEG